MTLGRSSGGGVHAGWVENGPAGEPTEPAAVRTARPVRAAAGVSVVIAAAAVIMGLLEPSLVLQHQSLILVIGFLVGLPHGAVDHLVPFWTGWVRRSAPSMITVLLGYVTIAVLTWAGLRWSGLVALSVLLVLSILHFGLGDLMADRDDEQGQASVHRLPSRQAHRPPVHRTGAGKVLAGTALVVAVLARGGPVVAGPLLMWPDQAEHALSAVQLGFTLPSPGVRILLAAVVGMCVLLSAVAALRSGDLRAGAEVVLLALLFVTVPPLAAFGVYFGAWHGLRHTARLVVNDPRNHRDLAAGRLLRPLVRFGISAAPPTAVAAAVATVLVVWAGQHQNLTGTVFTVLLALTVPHLVVVGALDLAAVRRRAAAR